MKKKTFVVLKPENTYPTIYITTDQKHAFEVFEASTVPLNVCELPIKNKYTKEILSLFENEWMDVNDFKVPVHKVESGYQYASLTVDEFLNILVQYPEMINKLISRNYWKDSIDIVANLEDQIFEFFKKFELENR
ncbi:hypothetical protein OTK59_24065 [Vibrio natriegens]|uniref:hypothetical protein n=1 Tax=Vibrio natriegens TaxID=691 RepID=UPI00228466BB|nr:hypothetical protein [Vibrio natriegens]MCY9879619.1 hypothetical protein [Vibrio natriegens]